MTALILNWLRKLTTKSCQKCHGTGQIDYTELTSFECWVCGGEGRIAR